MDDDPLDSEQIGDGAGMLPARPAETRQRIKRHIMPARDRDLADGVGHIVVGDGQEPARDVGRRTALPGRGLDRLGDFLHPRQRRAVIERLVPSRPEHRREMRRRDSSEHEVAVGHRERPAAAIASRSRPRPGALGPDPEAHPVEAADRSAARRHRMHLHHRGADSHPRDHALLG